MPFDFRKAEKEYYSPLEKPQLVIIPAMRFAAICGNGKPDDSNPSYIQADSLLHEFSCFLRGFSRLPVEIADSCDYTLPPLELMYFRNEVKKTSWTLLRRIPDFFTKEDISVIRQLYEKKSGISAEKIQILNHSDGMCIQMGHCKKTGKTSSYASRSARMSQLSAHCMRFSSLRKEKTGRKPFSVFLSADHLPVFRKY